MIEVSREEFVKRLTKKLKGFWRSPEQSVDQILMDCTDCDVVLLDREGWARVQEHIEKIKTQKSTHLDFHPLTLPVPKNQGYWVSEEQMAELVRLLEAFNG